MKIYEIDSGDVKDCKRHGATIIQMVTLADCQKARLEKVLEVLRVLKRMHLKLLCAHSYNNELIMTETRDFALDRIEELRKEIESLKGE